MSSLKEFNRRMLIVGGCSEGIAGTVAERISELEEVARDARRYKTALERVHGNLKFLANEDNYLESGFDYIATADQAKAIVTEALKPTAL
jgi:hypothetical protein